MTIGRGGIWAGIVLAAIVAVVLIVVYAGDGDGVGGGRAGRELGRPREVLGGAVLHEAKQPLAVSVVERAPGAPVLLHLLRPTSFRGRPLAARLPEDAADADG